MESISQLLIASGTVAVAAIVAAYVGRRRGLDLVEARADSELRKLVDAQAARLLLLEESDKAKTLRIVELEAKVRVLEDDLKMERAITHRLQADGR